MAVNWIEFPRVDYAGASVVINKHFISDMVPGRDNNTYITVSGRANGYNVPESLVDVLRRITDSEHCHKSIYTIADHERSPATRNNIEKLSSLIFNSGCDSQDVKAFMSEHVKDHQFNQCANLLIAGFKTFTNKQTISE